MRFAFLLMLAACAREANPDQHHRANVFGSVANCSSTLWYPGVTEPSAPRRTLAFTFVDRMSSDFRLADICLLIDDKSMLRPSDFDVVVPQLDATKSITWRGTVSPGKHHIRIYVTYRKASTRYEVKSTHDIDVRDDAQLTAVAFGNVDAEGELPVVQWHDAGGVDGSTDTE